VPKTSFFSGELSAFTSLSRMYPEYDKIMADLSGAIDKRDQSSPLSGSAILLLIKEQEHV
jgi:hypothetical protein